MEVAGINWTSEQAPTSFFKEKESRQTSLLKTKYILHVLGILFRKKNKQKKPKFNNAALRTYLSPPQHAIRRGKGSFY